VPVKRLAKLMHPEVARLMRKYKIQLTISCMKQLDIASMRAFDNMFDAYYKHQKRKYWRYLRRSEEMDLICEYLLGYIKGTSLKRAGGYLTSFKRRRQKRLYEKV